MSGASMPRRVGGHGTAKPGRRNAIGLALLALGLAAFVQPAPGSGLTERIAAQESAPVAKAAKKEALDAYAKLPLAFVPNAGQSDSRVRYLAQAGGASFFFTPREAVISLAKKRQGLTLRLAFVGADPAARIEGEQRGAGRVNYLLGNDPARWRTGLPTYHELVYGELWPGIDLHLRGVSGRLKYEFHLAPGASVRDIRLAYRGVRALALDGSGNLVLRTALGTLKDARPFSYQQIDGRRVEVESRFALGDGGNAYGFAVAAYDRRLPLIIDPGLLYSTYLGGSGADIGGEIAVDALGNAYVTGSTNSRHFPSTAGAFDRSFGGAEDDAFVTKLNPTGSALLYSTYLGGTGADMGGGIAVDAAGSAYVSGSTFSRDFPTTAGAFDTTFNGDEFNNDVFVTKLNSAGSHLLYSTYLGGSSFERGAGIAVDAAGSAYVTGDTDSINFPTTTGAFDTSSTGGDAFVAKLDPTGSALRYATYLGGGGSDAGRGITVDAAGNAHVTGSTFSPDFPTTAGAFDTSFNGAEDDAFVAKLNPTGSDLRYSTFLGGSSPEEFEQGLSIAVDVHGSAYVTGVTISDDFPTTVGAFDAAFGGVVDAFVAKLNPTGSALLYSTYLGGSGFDLGGGIAVDAAGSAYVSGVTRSTDFPTTPGGFDTSFNGDFDAFVARVNPIGSALRYSTYLGTGVTDFSGGIAVDAAGGAYVSGSTFSPDFPATAGAFDRSFNGDADAFVTKLDPTPAPHHPPPH